MLFFSAPIMYPITILPDWAQRLAGFNPFVQVLQDVRSVLLGDRCGDGRRRRRESTRGSIPIAIAFGALAVALLLHRREAPRFAERA